MEQAVVEYVVNAFWQLPLLACGAWLLLRLLRPNPRIQHGVWVAVLALAVILPLRGMPAASAPSAGPVMVAIAPMHALPSLRLGPNISLWMVRVYLVSVGVGLFRIAWAWRGAKLLKDNSRETCLGSQTMAAFAPYGQRLGVRLPSLRNSHAVSGPVVVGVRTVALILPDDFTSHTENEMRAALCHELAHVVRRDYLVNLACEVAAVPLASHPAMRVVLQRIRTTREMVCDAMAAEEMDSQLGYAKCLLALAHSMLGESGLSLGLFSKHTLEERMMQLTDNTTVQARSRITRAAAGLAVMIATGAIATSFHVTPTMAQAIAPPDRPGNVLAPATPDGPLLGVPVAEAPQAKHKQSRHKHDLENANREIAKATEMLNSSEFRQRMDDAQRQMAKADEMLNSPEFKRKMEGAQKQMAKADEMLNSPEFKRKMEDAQKQMAKADEMLNSPDFKRKMEDAQKQIDEMDQTIRRAFPSGAVTEDE